MINQSYAAFFLNFHGQQHQLADIRELVQWTADVKMLDDGCLVFSDGQEHLVDGFSHVGDGTHIPILPECADRIHNLVVKGGEVITRYFCMQPKSPTLSSKVTCQTCESCPTRRGRE